ncbi:MAG TPA: hypothetical protein VK591_02275, partial [Xanthobacteraceae bacterium]|nr:hypothetical protein [Xanthobacteraceae bacterium]
LTDDRLALEVRRLAALNQRLPVLLLLAHVTRPAKTHCIVDKGLDIGFRQIGDWNVADVLKAADDADQVLRRASGWDLIEPGFQALEMAGVKLDAPVIARPSDSVFPRELFSNTRGYIEKIVHQINGSYDYSFYDCCAVMCRRLGETLIIEIYESQGRAKEIKGPDDNFLMLSGLLGVLNKDRSINLGRNAKRGLESLKDLGDKSAHNRRFNARQPDIDSVKSDLRTAAEELLHLAKLT